MDALHQAIVWLFVTVNAARTMAYLPQIWVALKSRDGAREISTITWSYFALSHLTGALYSADIAHDAKLAGAFLCNFLACGVLLGVVLWRRRARSPNAGPPAIGCAPKPFDLAKRWPSALPWPFGRWHASWRRMRSRVS